MASETIKQQEIKRWEWKWLLPWKALKAMDVLQKDATAVLKSHYGEVNYKARLFQRNVAYCASMFGMVAYGLLIILGAMKLVVLLRVDQWIAGLFS